MVAAPNTGNAGDPVVTRLVAEDKVPWYKKPNMRMMYIWLFFCCMGVEMTSGFDSQLIGTLQFSEHFNKYFGDGYTDERGAFKIKPSLLGFVSSCYQLGSIIAVPVAPWFNQKYGRRWGIMAGSIIMVIGAIIQGFSQHVGMYIVARMILGAGILFAIISGSSLIGELSHPKERPVMTSLFNSSYFIGSILAAAITLKTVEINNDWAWRLPSLLQICPSAMQMATVFLLPESPRYLLSHDRDDEAFAILVKYHAEGDASSPLVQAEMAQIKSTIKLEMENSKQSWMTMFKTAGMRRRVLIAAFLGLFTQMSGNTLLSYYQDILFDMMGYNDSYTKTRLNMANTCWSLLNATIFALFITRYRRRIAFMSSSSSMTVCFIAMTICFYFLKQAEDAGTRNEVAGRAALAFYYLYGPCYNLGNNALTYTYLIELFPYSVRSRGIGVQQIFGKLAGFFSNNVNPLALTAIGWKFFAIYCGWIAFEIIFQFIFYPETYGRTLEELAFLFEDDKFNQQSAAAVEKQLGGEHQPAVSIEENVHQKV